MGRLHDDHIIGYSVNLKEKSIMIQTYNASEKRRSTIYFEGVLTHSFKGILEFNQILDIYDCETDSFVKDNQEELMKMKDHCWPIDYQTEQELAAFLNADRYRYIKIDSSYGMSGWILAKSYRLDE